MPSFLEGAFRYCGWFTRQAHSHFGLALFFLSREKRQAMQAVYAFCRVVDDVVDSADPLAPIDGPQAELHLWRQELAACVKGAASHPVAVALGEVIRQYGIPLAHFEEIVAGVEMDLTRKRYATFEELACYCERVASAVGLVSIKIFGCQHPAAERYAHDLGIALQLTNILRDIKNDLSRGRIYLPQDELFKFGLSDQDLSTGLLTELFSKMMAFQVNRAKDFYASAAAARRESREGRLLVPAEIMGGIYRRLLSRIERRRYDIFSRRVTVPAREQLWVTTKCLLSLS